MPHGRLFWRVYLHGVVLLLLVAVAVGLSGWALRRAPPLHAYPERFADYLSARAADLANPALIERDLRREKEIWGAELSVYRLDGAMVATNVDPPVPPLPAELLKRLEHGQTPMPRHRAIAVPVREGGRVVAYLAVGVMPLVAQATRLATILAVVLLALAFGSFPLARAITSPLEKLTSAAQRLGSGDLSARTGLKRRDEVGRVAVAFDEMADRLEKLVRGEKELLANVSHELRTPMARIRVALELAAEGDSQRSRTYLQEIAKDLEELDRLVEDVLTVARLDLRGASDGAPPLRRERLPAQAVIEHAAERFRSANPERVLELKLEAGLPQIDADESLLRRAIDNLLDNARKYSEPDKPVVLSATSKDGLTIEIVDQGIGIEASDLPNLFRPFFRTERSRSRGTGGVGLGLTLAKKIVEAHGGHLDVQSAVGKGTTVRLRVPAAQ